MTESGACQSCGMRIESGPYCEHCVDEAGALQGFEETLERMSQWARKKQGAASHAEAERLVLAHMANMPAWRAHPRVRAAKG